jgi:hypothetical protein
MNLIALLLLLAAAPDSETAWVTADVLRVRVPSGPDGAVVGRLRIGADAIVHERKDGWARVEVGPVRGWVLASHLGPKPIGLEQALRAAKAAKGAERIEWLERVVALDGGRRAAWESLAAAYHAAKLASQEAFARKVLDGEAPLYYFSACGRIDASFSAAAGFAPVAGVAPMPEENGGNTPETDGVRKAMGKVAESVTSVAWFPADGKPAGFPQAGAPEVSESDEVCTMTREYSLWIGGPRCDSREPRPEGLLVSAPVLPLALEEASPAEARRARAALAERRITAEEAEVSRVPGSPRVWEIRFEGVQAEAGGRTPVIGWAIADDAGKLAEIRIIEAGSNTTRRGAGPATWGRLWHSGLRIAVLPFWWEGTIPTAEAAAAPAASAGYGLYVVGAEGDVAHHDVVTFVQKPDPC